MSEMKKTNFTMLIVIVYMIFASLLVSYIIFANVIQMTAVSNIIISQIVMQLIPAAIYFIITKKKLTDVLLFNNPGFINCVLVVLMAILVQPLMMLLSGISNLFFENNIANTVLDMFGNVNVVFVILLIGAFPAIFEEIMYRGVILYGYHNISKHKAAILSGLFFGIMHLNPQQFLYAFALGVVLGYIVIYSRSIFCSMLFHFTINATQAIIVYTQAASVNTIEVAEAVSTVSIWQKLIVIIVMAVISLFFAPLFAIAFRAFSKYNQKRNQHNTTITDECMLQSSEQRQSVLTPSFFAIIAVYVIYIVCFYVLPKLSIVP